MSLKYETEIILRKNCDLTRFMERDRPAYCWCFNPIEDNKNFVPRAISVKRDNCESWALSFFDTERQAEDRLHHLTRNKPNLFKHLGDHIANGILDKEDGISEESDSNGHFNLHEYSEANFLKKFTIIKRVA